jgi:dihydroxyacetone kinase
VLDYAELTARPDTGDNLHFGLAVQQMRVDGVKNIEIIPCADDVAVYAARRPPKSAHLLRSGRKGGALVGRRALAGTVLVAKILGAASEAGMSFKNSLALGKATTDRLVSVVAALDHTHVPGRSEFAQIPHDTIEIGLGLHNEPVSCLPAFLSDRPTLRNRAAS